MPAITDAKLSDLQQYQRRLERELAGYRKYEVLFRDNPAAHDAVVEFIAQIMRHLDIAQTLIVLFQRQRKAFADLSETAYPELPVLHTTEAIKRLLQENEDSLDFANDHAEVENPRAKTLTFQVGEELDMS